MTLKEKEIVKKYAYAYMGLSLSDEKKIEDIKNVFKAINPFLFYLRHPNIRANIKYEIISKVISEELQKTSAYNLIKVLIPSKKIHLIGEIIKICEEIYLERNGRLKVNMYSKFKPEDKDLEMVEVFLEGITNKRPVIQWIKRDDITGGFILRWDNMIFDASIDMKLKKLKRYICCLV